MSNSHLPARCSRFVTRRIAPLSTALALAAAAAAGPLTPPDGPIGPTMKPLDQVEARTALTADTCPGDASSIFRITAPGSYYLTGNLIVPDAQNGIEIAASNVTLDLNGFAILGATQQSGFGVIGENSTVGIRVANGTVSSLGRGGIFLGNVSDVRIHDIAAHRCGSSGITVGRSSTVENCVAAENGYYGIETGASSVVRGCTARDNADTGIQTAASSSISDCTARVNGFYGIRCDGNGAITNCTAYENASVGFYGSGVYTNCQSTNNFASGFFSGYLGSTFINCEAVGNRRDGFEGTDRMNLTGCIARNNVLHGIRARHSCTIVGNTCINNGETDNGSGIYINGNGSRIQNNTVTGNDIGVHIVAPGNVVTGNSGRGNRVAAFRNDGGANSFGPTATLSTLNTATNPFANFALD